jgi:hypothetical protein
MYVVWYTGIGYARILINYVLYVGTVMNAVFIHFILLPSRKLFTLNSTNSNWS